VHGIEGLLPVIFAKEGMLVNGKKISRVCLRNKAHQIETSKHFIYHTMPSKTKRYPKSVAP
jgi:hypothetical protein